jgi:GntR family transcriptional regulator
MKPLKELDRRSSVPLHLQAEEMLRGLAAEARYQKGEHLPDEVTLARQFGISRNTLRVAITRLVLEGMLERRAGVGTRVRRGQTSSGLGAWLSFTREMAHKGIDVESFDVSAKKIRAGLEVTAALQVPGDKPILRLDRLRGWEGVPCVHFRSFLHPRLGLEPGDDFSGPLYERVAQRTKIRPDHSFQEIAAVAAEPWLAALLKVEPGSPLLMRKHIVYDKSGRPLEFAIDHIRSDRFTLTLMMRSEAK